MKKSPQFNLCTIVKDFTSDYMLHQYGKHYSKYNIKKVFILIHSMEKNANIEKIKSIFKNYFNDLEYGLSLYGKYSIEEEGIYFTNIYNNALAPNDWLLIADIDEFIEVEKINNYWFENYDLIKGILIDKIGINFDDKKSIFNNYPYNYFLHGILKTSFPYKVAFIKKKSIYVRINSGHHAVLLDKADSKLIRHKKEYLPIHHFKWREDTLYFLTKTAKELGPTQGHEVYSNEINYQIKSYGNKSEFFQKIKKGKLGQNTGYVDGSKLIFNLN